MYKIVKDIGNTENVYLQNTDTMAEINLGRATMEMMGILEEDGHKFSPLHPSDDIAECITTKEKWSFKVNNEETKDKLRRLAMPMKKPIRDQSKKDKPKEEKKIVDVLDIIYGLA